MQYRQHKRETTINFNSFAPELVSSKFAISIFVKLMLFVKRFALHIARKILRIARLLTFFGCLTYSNKAHPSELYELRVTQYYAAFFYI